MRLTLLTSIGLALAVSLLTAAWRAGDSLAARAGIGQGRPEVAGMLWPVQPALTPFTL